LNGFCRATIEQHSSRSPEANEKTDREEAFMTGLFRLTFTEFKLFVHDTTAVFFALALTRGMLAIYASLVAGGGYGRSHG
jgi:hypothetical protein